MIKLKLLVLFLGLLCTKDNPPSIQEVRESFTQSSYSEEKAEAFYLLTEKTLNENKSIYNAYHGAALILKAAHCSVFSKLSNFKKGKRLVEKAVALDPDNIEIRMIRLCIQANAPKILGYYKQIEEDKALILKNISAVSSVQQKEYLEGFIKDSGIFSSN